MSRVVCDFFQPRCHARCGAKNSASLRSRGGTKYMMASASAGMLRLLTGASCKFWNWEQRRTRSVAAAKTRTKPNRPSATINQCGQPGDGGVGGGLGDDVGAGGHGSGEVHCKHPL